MQQQISVKVRYDDVIVGDYIADILVENSVFIEVKAVSTIHNILLAQCLNYLKATEYIDSANNEELRRDRALEKLLSLEIFYS